MRINKQKAKVGYYRNLGKTFRIKKVGGLSQGRRPSYCPDCNYETDPFERRAFDGQGKEVCKKCGRRVAPVFTGTVYYD